MGIGYRIKEAREALGLTQEELGRIVGVTGSSITNYEKETSHPKETVMYKLIEALQVDANYLFQDAVKINKKSEIGVDDYELLGKYHALDDFGRRSVDITLERETERVKQAREAEKKIKELEQKKPQNTASRLFAYYGKIAAAGKSFGFEDLVSGATIEVPETSDNLHADYTIGVSGNSMEPTYYDGDIVYVKKVERLKTGDIGIFQKDNCIYIKEAGDNGLISHNSSYGFMPGAGVKLLGKVIGKVEEDYRIIK